MKCPLCHKEIDFVNVDWQGFEHCPECNGVAINDNNIANLHDRMRKKEYMQRIQQYGEEL